MGEASQAREARWRDGMLASQRGDADAYEKLLAELLPVVRGFIRNRVFDFAAQEDVVQNVFLSIHRARHTYRPERPFTPWLYAVARNAVTDHARARGRRAEREVAVDPASLPEPAVAPSLPGDDALDPALVAALEQLPPAQREAVVLMQLEALSAAEAAERAGVSVSAVKVRAHRGYRALRAALGGEGGDA